MECWSCSSSSLTVAFLVSWSRGPQFQTPLSSSLLEPAGFVNFFPLLFSSQVVDLSLCESIRHHLDLQKDNKNARFVKKALKFYTQLANQAVKAGHAVDIFACSLDQVTHRLRVLPSSSCFPLLFLFSFSSFVPIFAWAQGGTKSARHSSSTYTRTCTHGADGCMSVVFRSVYVCVCGCCLSSVPE